jgi:membrane protease subunit HflC
VRSLGLAIVILFILVTLVRSTAFVVDETEQVVITQFGRPVGDAIKDAGLYFRVPFIQEANYFPKNLLEWNGDPGQMPTKDKTFIWVDVFARWRVDDPLTFFQTVRNESAAQAKLDNIIESATRNLITSNPLIEAVRNSDREMEISEVQMDETTKEIVKKPIKLGRETLARAIMEQAKPKMAQFGIDLVDVRIKRINYVDEVQKEVYNRMIAERKQIAEKFRSEGRGESSKIAGDREKELKRITSEAYRTAQEIMGAADAEATRIYADAFNRDPEFYSFVNTLSIYKESLDKDTWVMLSTKSDLLKYLKKYSVQ